MGHTKRKRPQRGSRAVWPRKRAKRINAMVKNFAQIKDTKLSGFAGYKAGMTSIIIVDNRPKSPTKGEEIKKAVTILEAPALKVAAVRLYSKDSYGRKAMSELWAEGLNKDKDLLRKLGLPKKRKVTLDIIKNKLANVSEIRLIVYTQPRITGLGKKTPEVFEIPIGGNVESQFSYAAEKLGKEINASDIFKAGEFVDMHGVTKGKGFQGDIKRFGVRLESHKAEFGRRHRATMGPTAPSKVGWWIPMPGQMGFHKRTHYNSQILKIANVNDLQVNPISGLSHYGKVKGDFILIAGSVPGAKKRLIILSHAIRPASKFTEAPEVVEVSLRSQQQ
nr:50S ribosomal protein L3P [uncultured archaeon]